MRRPPRIPARPLVIAFVLAACAREPAPPPAGEWAVLPVGDVTVLDRDFDAFVQDFNTARGTPRCVVILSPT